jgi:hypothetical protein
MVGVTIAALLVFATPVGVGAMAGDELQAAKSKLNKIRMFIRLIKFFPFLQIKPGLQIFE